MPVTQTSSPPASPAAASALLSFSAPVGGDPRVIAGITTLTQKLLDAVGVALRLVTGGSIGDGTGNTVNFLNKIQASNGLRVFGESTHADGIKSVTGPNRIGRNVELDVTTSGTIAPAGTSLPMGLTNGRFFWTASNVTGGSGGITYAIDDTGCVDGDEFEVWMEIGVTGVIGILRPGGVSGALVALNASSTAQTPHARFRRVDGTWRCIRGAKNFA